MYTIKQVADLAGVSVRTLHHYDQIGLLRPTQVGHNGYRYYDQQGLLTLQQILFFRELEFPLAEIRDIMRSPSYHAADALAQHKRVLRQKVARLNKLIHTIDTTIQRMNTQDISEQELYDAFQDDDVKQYQAEANARWGNTDAYKISMAKVGKMTKEQMVTLKEDGKKLTQALADVMGQEVSSDAVQSLIQKHYDGINFFYPCSLSMYRALADMYVQDPRFASYYDTVRPGLATFVRDAVYAYIDKREGK